MSHYRAKLHLAIREAITPHRALVVLRFLLNSAEETDRIWPNSTTLCYLTNYIRLAETGEIFGLEFEGTKVEHGRITRPLAPRRWSRFGLRQPASWVRKLENYI